MSDLRHTAMKSADSYIGHRLFLLCLLFARVLTVKSYAYTALALEVTTDYLF